MRTFVVLAHAAPLDPEFSLDDLPGSGRLDVLCRCVGASFLQSHGLRDNVELHILIQDRLRIRLAGAELRYLSPDERNVASLLRGALEAQDEAIGQMEAEGTPGIYVSKRDLEAVLDECDGTILQLHEDGDPVPEIELPENPVFVLSDHEDFTDSETALLETRADTRVRFGPEALHADQALTVAHNYLDTGGYTRF